MERKSVARPLRVCMVVLVLIGLGLAVGGIRLILLGGSWYYLLAGTASIASGLLLTRHRRAALWLFALLLAASLIWAVFEVRFDFWQLGPRLDIWLLCGLYLLLPRVNRRIGAGEPARRGDNLPLALASLAAIAALCGGAFVDYHNHYAETPAERMAATGNDDAPGVAAGDWSAYGRSGYGNRYAPATQITPGNVGKLELAWTFHTGDLKGPDDPFEMTNQVTPLKVNNRLYLCSAHNIVFAIDPDSGQELWRYDPKIRRDLKSFQHLTCRGVSYYDADAYAKTASAETLAAEAADPAIAAARAACPRRIYAQTAEATIVALNADDGGVCTSFGEQGVVDMKKGYGEVLPGFLNPTSPPVVTRRLLVIGAAVVDNDSTDEPSGVILAFDVDSGRLVWNWDSGNPVETTPLPAGRTYVRNSPNSWMVSSVDEQLGLVYIPMGNQTPDIWGGNRLAEGERFNSAVVALEVASGKLRWVYQTVHHDIWDHDIPAQPTLVDLDRPEGKVPALIVPTKGGSLFVLDRRDGHLLVPAPERPMPQGAAEGDRTSPTQPVSELNFLPERDVREADMWGATPIDQLLCRIQFKQLRYEGPFTPPSEQGSFAYPGNLGVFEWGSASVDPVRQLLIANPNYMGFVVRLHRRDSVDVKGGSGSEQGLQPMTGTPFAVDIHSFLSPLKMPCQPPPWGYMAAVDLKTMRRVWMRKSGTAMDSSPLPLPFPLGFPATAGFPVGVPSLGGSVVTAGGLFFNSGTLDYYLRAYDVRNGAELWKARLPAGGQATPMSYVSDKSGRQYVVVMAGGHGSLGSRMGDSLVAYALPEAATNGAARNP